MLLCVYRLNFNKLMCDIPTYSITERGILHFKFVVFGNCNIMGAVIILYYIKRYSFCTLFIFRVLSCLLS